MKLKWYLIAIVTVVSSYLGYNFGKLVERVNEYDNLGKQDVNATSQYNKLHNLNKTSMTFVEKDSIIHQENWWIGYRQCIRTQRKRLEQ